MDIENFISPISDWSLEDDSGSSTRFLNHGSFGAAPLTVLKKQVALRDKIERYPDRFFDGDLAELWRISKDAVADFVGADRSDLVLTPNATFGTSSVLHSLDWQRGDEVIFTNHAYASVAAHIQVLKKQGVVTKLITLPDPYPGHGSLIESVTDTLNDRTKLVVVDHITSPSAMIMPVQELTTLVRQFNCSILVDGAHAPGQIDLRLREWQPDFYVGNCHKWLFSPRSASFLYVKNNHKDVIRPSVVGNFYHDGFTSAFSWLGTMDVTGLLCVQDGIDFWKSLGGKIFQDRNHHLAVSAQNSMLEALGQEPHMPQSNHYLGAMAAVPIRGREATTRAEAQHWRQYFRNHYHCAANFSVIDGQLWVRVCAQAYQCAEDYRYFAQALRKEFIPRKN